MKHEAPWELSHPPSFPPLDSSAETEVLIIGGGITGITAAHLLAKSGRSVILLEKNVVCSGETHSTTAHISYPSDMRLRDLASKFGENHAGAVWDAGQAAADHIRRNICQEEIDCDYRQVPAWLYAAGDGPAADEVQRLQEDADLAQRLGFDARYLEACPVTNRPSLAFGNLAKFHPGRYLARLAESAQAAGARLHEHSAAEDFDAERRTVTCNGYTISYQHLFLATHVPLQGADGAMGSMLLQTKLAAYSTYAVEASLPSEVAPEGLWWDTSDPYFYLRVDKAGDRLRVIAGGQDHKTGQSEDTEACYAALARQLLTVFPQADITRRWSGQVIETVDGLPYIGEHNGQYVATGFSGTGMTFGTLAAMMFAGQVQGIQNPWSDLFSVERKELSSTWDYVKENKDYPFYMTKSLFTGKDRDPETLANGEGAVLRLHGKKVAASRTSNGELTVLSAICPHLGCVVAWNSADQTWDCPCHGSRFTADGEVMAGPAESPLKPVT